MVHVTDVRTGTDPKLPTRILNMSATRSFPCRYRSPPPNSDSAFQPQIVRPPSPRLACPLDVPVQVVEFWASRPGDGYVYYVLRPPWVAADKLDSFFALHPEVGS